MNKKYSFISILVIALASHLSGGSISSIQSLIKSGDFMSANELIDNRISINPNDSEAYIYKTLAEIGIFFENTLPST